MVNLVCGSKLSVDMLPDFPFVFIIIIVIIIIIIIMFIIMFIIMKALRDAFLMFYELIASLKKSDRLCKIQIGIFPVTKASIKVFCY